MSEAALTGEAELVRKKEGTSPMLFSGTQVSPLSPSLSLAPSRDTSLPRCLGDGGAWHDASDGSGPQLTARPHLCSHERHGRGIRSVQFDLFVS